MLKVLIAEDDSAVFCELKKLLEANGYAVVDGRQAGGTEQAFDIAVLDINMPGRSGYELCREIRRRRDCPIIFLTAQDTAESELTAFNVGGDDYVRKPFSPAVLLARMSRLLKSGVQEVLERGALRLDTVRMDACVGDRHITLTKTEFAILKILMESRAAASAKTLIEKLWDDDAYVDENTLYVNMTRLRKKLEDIGAAAITTVRGEGYVLEEP